MACAASDLCPDIVLITESWCHSDITNAFLGVPGYELQTDLRLDRDDTTKGAGGGLLVYSKDGLQILPDDKVSLFKQHCNFRIVTEKEELKCKLVYRSPSAPAESVSALAGIIRETSGKRLIIGDCNLPNIDWERGVAAGGL